MAQKKITITVYNGTDFDELMPKTLSELVTHDGSTIGELFDGHVEQIATKEVLGHIMPDGETTAVDEEGKLKIIAPGIALPISANDVSVTFDRQFVSSVDLSLIATNSSTVASHTQRIVEIEHQLANITTTDEKVRMSSTSVAGFLENFVDGETIQNFGDKLAATSLLGLTATLSELNLLQGATQNIQAQLNALSSAGNFKEIVDTHANLSSIQESQLRDMVLVRQDETFIDSPTTIYICTQNGWEFATDFKGGEIRDFMTNPIKLENEVSGILPKIKYEKQNAADTPFTDTTGLMISKNVNDALIEVFRAANDIFRSVALSLGDPLTTSDTRLEMLLKMDQLKELLADAISLKGVPTTKYASLKEMATNISYIPNVTLEGKVQKITKLNVKAPYELKVVLNEPIPEKDIISTLVEYVYGEVGKILYDINFDNGDESDFQSNPSVVFDGVMKLRSVQVLKMEKDESWSEEGGLFRKKIHRNNFGIINKVEVVDK